MKKIIIYLIVLSILHSIMFFSNNLGLNVILFTIPLLSFLIYTLKINNKIVNKKGLLFIVPITFLSLTYLFYDNIFRVFNVIIIPILYILMYIYTIKPTFNLNEIISDFTTLLFGPLDYVMNFIDEVKSYFKKLENKRLKSILIVLPIVIVILFLLASADTIFRGAFTGIINLFKNVSIFDVILRIVLLLIMFIYTGASIYNLIYKYKKQEVEGINIKPDNYTIKLLLTILNIIYIIFDIIQIRSLLLHKVGAEFDYAQYARSGFFQLMVISLINLVIILISKMTREDKYTKWMSTLMIFLTYIIIASSFYRMYLYESTYGYTILRLLVYVALITESIILIPTIRYIFNNKVNILKHYMIIVILIYTLINTISIDYIIAYRNINRYYEVNKIDLEYLKNYNADNIPQLIDFYNETSDRKLKKDIKDYIKEVKDDFKTNNVFEYNISKNRAISKINSNK